MAFNLLGYRDKYKDYFKDAPLEDVAKDAFTQGGWDKETDFDTWKKSTGVDSVIQEDTRKRNPSFEDKLREATADDVPEKEGTALGAFAKTLTRVPENLIASGITGQY